MALDPRDKIVLSCQSSPGVGTDSYQPGVRVKIKLPFQRSLAWGNGIAPTSFHTVECGHTWAWGIRGPGNMVSCMLSKRKHSKNINSRRKDNYHRNSKSNSNNFELYLYFTFRQK